jgi:hypothetical protein
MGMGDQHHASHEGREGQRTAPYRESLNSLRAFSRTVLAERQTLFAEGASRLPRHPASSQASRD